MTLQPRKAETEVEAPTAVVWSEPDQSLYDLFLANGRHDVGKWHHYFPIYERYFARFRGKTISLLEIGVSLGGSVRMWRKYFGPGARITGIDIDPDCLQHCAANIEICIGDQADSGFLEQVAREYGPFDIIIDDGGHTARQQIISFDVLSRHVKEGGVYLVEDTHTSLWPQYIDHPQGLTFIDLAKTMAEKLTWWHLGPTSFARYNEPPHRRQGKVTVPDVTSRFFSIAFYDSVVAFERAA